MIYIDDASDKKIEEFITLKEATLLKKNLCLCESEKIYLKLIHNNIHIQKILCLKEAQQRHGLSGENIFVCSREVLNKISGFKTEYDMISLFKHPAFFNLDALDDKIILLNGLTSPENVGSIVRSAAAFNVNSLIFDSKTCSPYLRRSIRVSMGNIFSMKSYQSINLISDLGILKKLGYSIIGTANIQSASDFTHFRYPKKSVLIIGSEGHGIDQEILNFCDHILYIPINASVAHLNAANAASIFLSRF